MGLNLAHGGHLSHGSLVNTSGIIYTPCEYNLKQETGRVDYDQMEEVALREKPKMIIGVRPTLVNGIINVCAKLLTR